MVANSLSSDFGARSPVRDFSGQRLRGQSFQGQDLTGANFRRADIRGTNFRGATLTGADFAHAKAGLTPLRQGVGLALVALCAGLSGGIAYALSRLVGFLLLPDVVAATKAVPVLGLLSLLTFLLLVALRVGLDRLNKLLMTVLVVLVILISMILGGYATWGNAIAMLSLALALAAGLAQLTAILVAVAELIHSPLVGCAIGAVVGLGALIAAEQTQTPAWIPVGAVALGIAIAWRSFPAVTPTAHQKHSPSPAAIAGWASPYPSVHTIAVAWAAGGTCFKAANLTDANFSQARLNNTDLRQATLTRTRFYGAIHLDLAWCGPSILQQPAVRHLLVTGQGRQQSFVEANLSGANLNGADLSGAILRGADLSHAALCYANLEQADLTRVNAVHTDFRQALLTGACLTDWNIDPTTQFDSVDCRYIYQSSLQSSEQFSQRLFFNSAIDSSHSAQVAFGVPRTDRLPSQGDWQPGDFTRQFAQVDHDAGSIFALAQAPQSAINPQEILASLMVLVRLAIADQHLEAPERELLTEALKALQLPAEITVERLLDDRTSLDILLAKINSPIIREKVYQSAYLMARIDGELEMAEEALLERIQTSLALSAGKVEKLQGMVAEAQDRSILEQVQAITDPAQREAAVNTNIRLMSLMHAFSGAMPIPGFAIVTHLMIYKDQVELVQKIGRIWGYPADYKSPALDQALFGTMGATAARVALSNVVLLIPVWGSVIGASTAFSMTWAIGQLTQQFFASGGTLDETTLTEQFAQAKQLGLKVFQESQAMIVSKQQEITTAIQELHQLLRSGSITQQDYLLKLREYVRNL
jgi:uncharacterized protein YjbI with pentapeptide repeats/uncharacterized protein (DUF697 family)